jgi:hypothetical protein
MDEDMTQEQVAKYLGWSAPKVSRFETGMARL